MSPSSTIEDEATAKQKTDKASVSYNPYLAARKEWNERYGDYIKASRQWKAAAFTAIAISALAVVGLLYQAGRSKFIPFVVEVDKLGRPMPVSPLTQAQPLDPRLIRASLATFVNNTRTVSADATMQKQMLLNAYAYLSQGDAANQALNEFFRKESPFERAQTETVTLEINTVLPITKDTWQIEWTETVRTRKGVVKESAPWKATATIYIVPPTTEAQILRNPLGIFIREYTWAKQL